MFSFTLPKPLPDSDIAFSWVIVGVFSAWGGIVRYLMENKVAEKKITWQEVLKQILISGFTGFLAGVYGYENGYSEFMTIIFSGLGGAFGGNLLDLLWKRLAQFMENKTRS